jgi:glycosyltransferase 2 family protein
MKRPVSARWWLAGLAIGGLMGGLALAQASLHDSARVLLASHAGWAAAAWLAGLGFMALKAWRWQGLLLPLHRFGLRPLHAAVYAGTAANLLVPHSGELLRAQWLGRQAGQPASPILATVALERLLDFAALVLLALLGLLLQPQRPQALLAGAGLGLVVVLLGLALAAAALRPGPVLRATLQAVLGRLPARWAGWLGPRLRRSVAGLQALQHPRRLLALLALSLLQWGCIVAAIWCCAQAVGAGLPVAGAVLVFVCTVVGLTLPAPPLQLGATQLAFVWGFGWHGAQAAPALAASALYTAVVLGWMLLGGALVALRATAAQGRPPSLATVQGAVPGTPVIEPPADRPTPLRPAPGTRP